LRPAERSGCEAQGVGPCERLGCGAQGAVTRIRF
jgi:hypothetical protein